MKQNVTEAKCLLRILAILLGLLEIELLSPGSLIELIGLELFDFCARILFIPSHVFFIFVKLSLKNLVQYCCLLMRVNVQILFLYILYLTLSPDTQSLFLTLIDFRKPLVIHGLENCFALRLEIVFIGPCLFTSLLNLL